MPMLILHFVTDAYSGVDVDVGVGQASTIINQELKDS